MASVSTRSSIDDGDRRPGVFVFSQFLWPDDAPTGIYSEQLADALTAAGVRATLVAGSGAYRPGRRAPPATRVERLAHRSGGRTNLAAIAAEYDGVRRAFRAFVRRQVRPGDVVVMSSAPPTTLPLHRDLRRAGATSVYWLQDFYPELVRGIVEPPGWLRRRLSSFWRAQLSRWDHVVKAAGNLGYEGPNARVFRNWPTLDLGAPRPSRPGTALYSGNLSYAHDIEAFLELCETLRREGFEVTVRGDGKWLSRLPPWLRVASPLLTPDELVRSYWEAEVHLVAGHPRFPTAVFPSKYWNSRASGRRIRHSGFAGPMLEELERAATADYTRHLPALRDFIAGLVADPAGRG